MPDIDLPALRALAEAADRYHNPEHDPDSPFPAWLTVKELDEDFDTETAEFIAGFDPVSALALIDQVEAAGGALDRIAAFMDTVHGLNEGNVLRGYRKALAGETTTFGHEVSLNVYGAPCGHEVPDHYPEGYGTCDDCLEAKRSLV